MTPNRSSARGVEHHVAPMRPRYVALPPLAALALALVAAAPAPAAVVQLTPAAAPPGARAHVSGAGFVPGRSVLVRLAGRTVVAGTIAGDGTFALPVPISGALQARTRPVQVVSRGVTLSPSLRIVDGRPAGAPVSVASGDGVRLAMAPTVAGPGSSVLIRAAGLPANARVTFALTGGPRAVVRASRRGNARARLMLPLLRTGAGLALVRYRGSALAVSTYALPTGVTVPALPPPTRAVPLLAAVGDIACRPGQARTPNTCHQAGTAALLGQIGPDIIAPLGDEQYERGTAA